MNDPFESYKLYNALKLHFETDGYDSGTRDMGIHLANCTANDIKVIVGGGEVAKQLHTYFCSDDVLGVRLLGVFSDNELDFKLKKSIFSNPLNEMEDFLVKNDVDEVYYTLPLTYTNKIKRLITLCDHNMIRFKIVPDFRGFIFKRVTCNIFWLIWIISS